VSVLVNGSPTKEFIPKKGLREEDPLAPFLFLIIAEGLVRVYRIGRIGVDQTEILRLATILN